MGLAAIALSCGQDLTEAEERRLDSLSYDIRQDSRNPELYFRRGRFYGDLCLAKEAVEDLTTSIELTPNKAALVKATWIGDPLYIQRLNLSRTYAKRAENHSFLGKHAEANRDKELAMSYGYPSGESGLKDSMERAKKRAELGCP